VPRSCDARFLTRQTISFFFPSVLSFLLAAVTAFAQTPQNRYSAYSTYLDPDPRTQIHDQAPSIAATTSGQVCAVTEYFLSLINPDGTLVYQKAITSLGVFKDFGAPFRVAIDSAGDCYLAGYGPIVPTPGAYQSKKSTGMYVAKFDPHGNNVFATYMGGSGYDVPIGGIALDPSGNIWLTGTTNSNDFPVTPNAIQSSFQGGATDAFIAELNPAGTMLLYGTYLGGSNDESSTEYYATGGIAIDSSGNVYVTGTTFSTNFPVLNALQPTLSGTNDAFVTKISNAGTLLYSTYYGGGAVFSTGIAADSAGEASFVAFASSGAAGFVTKLNSDDSALVYSTFLPGLVPSSIQVDSFGNASFAGITPGYIVQLLNPIQSEPSCCFLMDLDPNGNLIFSSQFGGPTDEAGEEMKVWMGMDSNSNVYVGSPVYGAFSPPLLSPIYGTFSPCCYDEPLLTKIALGTGASFSMPTTWQFAGEQVGSTKTLAVTLYNTGTTDIDISGITVNEDFTLVGNLCHGTLTAGTQCNLTVSFTPTEGGARNGTITINDDSPGNPHIIQLAGIGLAPGISLNPTTLTFPAQGINSTSPAQNVTMQNTGGASLSISQIAISGANAGDFAELNTCGLSLAAGASCTISVTFTPTALGPRAATLNIIDAVGTQTVNLTGTGTTSLGLGIASGGSSSATVTAGSKATYTLSIGGGGLSGTATLSCTGAPAEATCTVPDSENLSATTASTLTVTVTTTAPSSAALQKRPSSLVWFWAVALIGIVWLPAGQQSRRFAWRSAAILSLLLVMFLASCGGGNGGGGTGGSGGTPAGTYNLTVMATMGSTHQSQALKLTVN
jgi:Abnormal spindle-like microcephaly-assoc'd, ASPM-SPD-2-Hydin/Beta-propeller repeat